MENIVTLFQVGGNKVVYGKARLINYRIIMWCMISTYWSLSMWYMVSTYCNKSLPSFVVKFVDRSSATSSWTSPDLVGHLLDREKFAQGSYIILSLSIDTCTNIRGNFYTPCFLEWRVIPMKMSMGFGIQMFIAVAQSILLLAKRFVP